MSSGTFGFKGFKNRALELPAGVNSVLAVDVSPGGRARLRYNDTAKQLEQSIDGGAYTPLGGTGAGPWDQVGTDVFPDSTGWNVIIGGATASAYGEKLRVTGSELLEGSLRISGVATPDVHIEMADGALAGVSNPNEGRIRYRSSTQQFETSTNGAAWVPLGASPWTESAGVVYPDNVTDDVVVGAAAMYGSEKFRVLGTSGAEPAISIGHPDDFKVILFEYAGGKVRQIDCEQPVGAGYAPGTPINILCGVGQDTAGSVGEGGFFRVNAGAGGNNTGADANGGPGADAEIFGGNGGSTAGTGFSGGNGGGVDIGAGRGGTGTSAADGGRGGNVLVNAGQGGLATGSGDEGDGGQTTVRGGNGGGPAGAGGDLYLYGGWKGTTNPGGASGDVYIRGGRYDADPTQEGRVFIGDDWTREIQLSNAGNNAPINVLGTGIVSIASGQFVVGASSMYSTEKLRVVGDVSIQGDIEFPRGPNYNIQIEQAADVVDGDQLYVQAGQGGNASATNGRIGGRLWLRSGPGGNTTQAGALGGNGGILELWGGYGGQVTGATGTGGVGGVVHLYAGEGGFGAGGADGGAGGDTTVQGGAGGGSASGTGGDGGNVLMRGGGSTQDGGTVTIDGGAGGASDGDVKIANASTNEVTIGNATDNPRTSFLGSGLVTFSGDIEVSASAAAIFSERAGDPGGVANKGKLYTKDVAGVTELFYQRSNGTVVQLS